MEPGWIVACISPRAVAPHGNFAQDSITGYSLLALVTDFRPREFQQYLEQGTTDIRPWANALITQARESLNFESQPLASKQLAKLVSQIDVPLGARIAAALWATLTLTDLDRDEESIDLLEGLLGELSSYRSFSSVRPASFTVGRDLLRLQLAFRKYEIGDRQAALDELAKLEGLQPATPDNFEDFVVSPSISWSSTQVQEDIALAVDANALGLRSRIEGFNTQTWTHVLRGRPTWPETQLRAKAASRDAEYRDRTYRRMVESARRVYRFGQSDDIELKALGTLLAAEFAGDVFATLEGRKARAKLLLLGRPEDSRPAAEALRLLRRTGDDTEIKNAVQWVRSQGPAHALREAGESILGRPTVAFRVSRNDVEVLSGASDMLTDENLFKAFDVVKHYLTAGTDRVASLRMDAALKAVTRFLPWPNGSEHIAAWCVELAEPLFDSTANLSPFLQVVHELSWERVTAPTRSRWFRLAERPGGREQALLSAAILSALDRTVPTSVLERCGEYERIAFALRTPGGLDSLKGGSEQTIGFCIEALDQVRAEARQGGYGFGGPDLAELAVAVAEATGSTELWERLRDFLLDRHITKDQKSRGLDRMVASAEAVPTSVINSLRLGWTEILSSAEGVFGLDSDGSGPSFPAAIRLGACLRLTSRSEIITAAVRLTGSANAIMRIEGAKCIRYAASSFGWIEWAHVLLMQLCQDDDPVVRAESAKSLASLMAYPSSLSELVVQAVASMLHEDGVLIPLFTVHGLQQLDASGRVIEEEIRSQISAMSTAHSVRVVREACLVLVTRLTDTTREL